MLSRKELAENYSGMNQDDLFNAVEMLSREYVQNKSVPLDEALIAYEIYKKKFGENDIKHWREHLIKNPVRYEGAASGTSEGNKKKKDNEGGSSGGQSGKINYGQGPAMLLAPDIKIGSKKKEESSSDTGKYKFGIPRTGEERAGQKVNQQLKNQDIERARREGSGIQRIIDALSKTEEKTEIGDRLLKIRNRK